MQNYNTATALFAKLVKWRVWSYIKYLFLINSDSKNSTHFVLECNFLTKHDVHLIGFLLSTTICKVEKSCIIP